MELLLDRPPWYLIGATVALITIALVALVNGRIGIVTGWSDAVERVQGRRATVGWKTWFVIGVIGGGLLFRLLAGQRSTGEGYGWVTRTFDSPVAVAVVLLVGSGLIGYGSKLGRGCTSGNGIGGCSFGSPASFVATATFMAVAVAASFVIKGLT